MRRRAVAMVVATTCGACASPAPSVSAPAVMASAAPSESASTPPPVADVPEPPSDVWLWLHVEHPARIASLATGPFHREHEPYKHLDRWLAQLDPDAPADLALSWFADPVVRFGSRDPAGFRAALERLAPVEELAPRLVKVHGYSSVTCQLPPTDARGPVACGDDGVRQSTAPWLATDPRPEGEPADARVVVWTNPSNAEKKDKSAEALAGFNRMGLTIRADGGDATTAFEAHVAWNDSTWAASTQSSFAPAPPAFARVPPAAAQVVVSSGGGPVLVGGASMLSAINEGMSGYGPPAMAEWQTVHQRPWLQGRLIDVEAALPAAARLARMKVGPAALQLAPSVLATLIPYEVLGVMADFATVERLVRTIASAARGRDAEYVLTAAPAQTRLPKPSLFVDEVRKLQPGESKPPSLLVVGDGDVTWMFEGDTHPGLARLARAVLSGTPTSAPDLGVGGDVLARGYSSMAMIQLAGFSGPSDLMGHLSMPRPSEAADVIDAARQIEQLLTGPSSFVRGWAMRDPDGNASLHLDADAHATGVMIADLVTPLMVFMETMQSWYRRPLFVFDRMF
jgi:hypothetical protein